MSGENLVQKVRALLGSNFATGGIPCADATLIDRSYTPPQADGKLAGGALDVAPFGSNELRELVEGASQETQAAMKGNVLGIIGQFVQAGVISADGKLTQKALNDIVKKQPDAKEKISLFARDAQCVAHTVSKLKDNQFVLDYYLAQADSVKAMRVEGAELPFINAAIEKNAGSPKNRVELLQRRIALNVAAKEKAKVLEDQIKIVEIAKAEGSGFTADEVAGFQKTVKDAIAAETENLADSALYFEAIKMMDRQNNLVAEGVLGFNDESTADKGDFLRKGIDKARGYLESCKDSFCTDADEVKAALTEAFSDLIALSWDSDSTYAENVAELVKLAQEAAAAGCSLRLGGFNACEADPRDAQLADLKEELAAVREQFEADLQTAKEEAQKANEALGKVTEELAAKEAELAAAKAAAAAGGSDGDADAGSHGDVTQ